MNRCFHCCSQLQVLGSYDCCPVWLVYLWDICVCVRMERNIKRVWVSFVCKNQGCSFCCSSFQAINLKIKLGVQIDYRALPKERATNKQTNRTMRKFIEYHYYDLFGWHLSSDFHPSMVHKSMEWVRHCNPRMTLIELSPSSETLNRLKINRKQKFQKSLKPFFSVRKLRFDFRIKKKDSSYFQCRLRIKG